MKNWAVYALLYRLFSFNTSHIRTIEQLLAFIANPIDLYITISLYMKAKSLFNCLLNIIICADVRGVKSADMRAATVDEQK